MLGERVAVVTRTQTGTDGMGEPTYSWESVEVANVLVKPTAGDSDPGDDVRPDGVRVSYTLAFPKTAHGVISQMRGSLVALLDRGMSGGTDEDSRSKMLRVLGEPDFVRPCPTQWDSLVHVGRFDG